VVGEEGDLDRATNNVEVRRNVVVTSNDGLRLETTVLRWEAATKRLWTDAPVVLTRDGSVVRGSGLDVRMDEEATTITGPVRATVTVDSDKMERFGKESLVIFTGNVVARQNSSVQYADRMEVYLDEKGDRIL